MTISEFINQTLRNNVEIQKATNGRIYEFETEQGVHDYPIIFWKIISDNPISEDLFSTGEAWKCEVQVSVFARSSAISLRLADVVRGLFNRSKTYDEEILSSRANQVMPSFDSADSVIHSIVRVFINHKISNA